MKIAIITTEYPPFVGGGQGISAGLVVEKLRKYGISVDVYVFSTLINQNMNIKTDMGSTIFIRRKYDIPFLFDTELFMKLTPYLKNYDLIHGYGIEGAIALYFIKLITQIPIIATLNREEGACIYYKNLVNSQCTRCNISKFWDCAKCRTNEIINHRAPSIVIFSYFLVYRFFLKKFDKYILLSNSLKDIYLICGFDEEKMEIIPNFYDDYLYEASREKCIDIPSKTIKILYVGRLSEQKGVINLIKAFIDINFENIELWIVGEGSQKDVLKSIAEKSNKKNDIKFFGFMDYAELAKIYNSANIFVHPCIWPEAFGRTILEAMLFKLAIITSNRGAPQEIIGDTGLVFEAENLSDLKYKLVYFICNIDARIRFGFASYQKVISDYSPDNIINDIINVYSNVIKSNGSH